MNSPQLPPSQAEGYQLLKSLDEPSFSNLSFPQIWNGVKTISGATLATSLSLLYMFLLNLISLAFISNLKDAAMIGGMGLGFVCSNCCAYILMTSIDQGVNALAAQAYGAEKYDLVGRNYHRGLFCILVVLIPVLVLLAFTKPILVYCGIDEMAAEYAWQYIEYAYPSFFFYGFFDCTKSFLYAQKIFKPILYTQTITTALHFFWAWLFITKFEMGPIGAAIAKNIYEFSNMLGLFIYIHYSESVKGWTPFSSIEWRRDVFVWAEFKVFLSVVIPMAALLFLDMACYEIFTILAGQFGEDQLAVHVAIANSATVYYSIPLGLSIAMMTFVGGAMGRGETNAAKNFTYYGLIVDFMITIAFMILLWACRDPWATLFSPNENVKIILLDVLKIYMLFVLFDGIQVALSGTMKGIGKQNAATIGLVISYYFIALPLIYYLSFHLGWQVAGIWSGFLVGIISLLLLYFVVMGFTSFDRQAKKIQEQMGRDGENAPLLH